jgi:Membrane protein involved in the export of O-antigen and teichoic acid
MSRSKNAIRNISWGVINKIIATFLPFLTRTALLYKLGTEYIGLNSLFTSILGLLSLSELGIGTALIFNMYEPLANGDASKVCALMNLYKKCYKWIGVIVLAIGLLIMPFLNSLIASDCPVDVNIYILYAVYLLNTVLSYWLFAYKKSLLIACQRVDIQSNINTIILLTQNISQLVIVLIFSNYYFYLFVLPVCTVIENIVVSSIVEKKYSQFKPNGNIRLSELGGIKKKIVGLLFQRIGNAVLCSVDSVVISSFLGLVALGTYNNYYYVINAVFGFMAIIQTSLKPVVGNAIVLETKEKNYSNFKMINFIYMWIVTWCACTLFSLYEPFMSIWVKEKAVYGFPMILILVIYFFTYKWGDMLFVYQEAAGIWWETRYVPLCAAILNLIVNIVLVNAIGIVGIQISTILSVVFIYDIGYARVLFKTYFGRKRLKGFLMDQLFYLVSAVISCGTTYYICSKVTGNNFIIIVIRFIICLILPNIMLFLFSFKRKEFVLTKQLVLKKVRRE